ncbi:DUF2207 domain-containing protein [Geodermatophilus sabuli]|uniref:DUF2207 domain-containing protein n=1 Tax=Geodermatophilus sabuli TaxID=1564158 RepID=A0A7K3VUZ2_9ACTN|nr:DUF2207 domain-containing protein [Geodermatophilus sabuli]NEK56461.1 DUF2207 domain-containing protein [Geodermatophilus sabuli]
MPARGTMGRGAARRLAALLLVTGVLAVAGCSGDGAGERIRSYDIGITAAADGSLTVEETIDYDFAGEERHGIVRSVPDRVHLEQTLDRRYPVDDVTVRSPTGAPTATEVSGEDGGLSIRVGDEDTEISGRHTYVLTYRVAAVADPGADGDRLAWNAVGTGWEVPIEQARVRLSGPPGAVPSAVDCVVGGADARTPCAAETGPGGELRAAAADLDPGEGLTVGATFPAGTFAGAEPVLEETFSPALAFRLTPATGGLALAGLLALVLPVLARSRRGSAWPRRGEPVAAQLTPPADARPAQLGTVLDGYAQRHEVTATLLDLAVRGALRIEEVDGPDGARAEGDPPADWRLVRTADGGDDLRGYERQLLDEVFAEGDVVTLSDLQARFGAIASRTCAAVYDDVVALGWFTAHPAAVRRRWWTAGALVFLGGAALTAVLALTTTWALAGTGVALAGLVLLGLAGRMPRRTAAGAQLRERTAAFRDSLAAAEPRWLTEPVRVPDLAGAARTDTAVRYLPHAVALGVAEQWSRAVDRSGAAVAPDWYTPAPGASSTPVWPALLVFSSPTNPALAPPAPAGGAGTSVGGAAGGGGGGSW